MSLDFLGVAAYGRSQGLGVEGCVELWAVVRGWSPAMRSGQFPKSTLLSLDAAIGDIRDRRMAGQRDGHQPVMTEEQWQEQRHG